MPDPEYEVDLDEPVAMENPVQNDSAQRKATPIWSGVMRYFPDALAAVARLSKAGNDKHNPGQPLHWAREKSTDHGDCIARHQLTPEAIDPETGELHAASVAWRALAQLQLLEEQRRLEQLSGPMGKMIFGTSEAAVTIAAEPVFPSPGDEWEPGRFLQPAWASETTLIDFRAEDEPDAAARVSAAHHLAFLPVYRYRRHRA